MHTPESSTERVFSNMPTDLVSRHFASLLTTAQQETGIAASPTSLIQIKAALYSCLLLVQGDQRAA